MKLGRSCIAVLLLVVAASGWGQETPTNAFQMFGWAKPDPHIPYPQSRPLNQTERDVLAKVTLPMKCDYSPLVTLVHCQGGGGCGGYTASAIFDLLKKRECPYAPNGSYRFQEYFYNESRKGARQYELNQLDVLQIIGCAPESRLPTNYDPVCPAVPSKDQFVRAKSYRLQRYSDIISQLTVDSLKRMLVLFGPLAAFGDTPGSPPDGHVFALIGYDDLARQFTILNSYGDGWGQNGMAKVPYASIEKYPSERKFPRFRSVRYAINSPTPPALFPYVARIDIHHDQSRNHLTVKLGVVGQVPETVWEHPNQVKVPDRSRNLVIDVPLPDYASKFWPPAPLSRWFVEVSDDSAAQPGKKTIGSIRELMLVDRTRAAARAGPPMLYRPGTYDGRLPEGGKITVHIP